MPAVCTAHIRGRRRIDLTISPQIAEIPTNQHATILLCPLETVGMEIPGCLSFVELSPVNSKAFVAVDLFQNTCFDLNVSIKMIYPSIGAATLLKGVP